MRALKLLSVAILSVLVGSAALAFAQDDKQPDDKPARQEEPKPEPKQDDANPPRPDEAKPSKQDAKQDKDMEKQDEKPDQARDQAVRDQDEDRQEHPDMKGDNTRPAGKGGHIPDDKFRAHFGQSHHFSAQGVIVAGQSQFQYGGYNFEFVDAWPAAWAYTDDCYIDYIDGEYFLFDLRHPAFGSP
jgi:hypothetical protein